METDFYSKLYGYSINNFTWKIILDIHKALISNSFLNVKEDPSNSSYLNSTLFGKEIENIIGIGSGFDARGNCVEGLFNLGCGFIEIGPVSPNTQMDQNSSYISFKKDQLIWRNDPGNMGILFTKSFIKSYVTSSKKLKNKLIGINLIPNKNVKDLAPYLCDKDYEFSAKEICDIADYMVINLSGFNKSGLLHYFQEDSLDLLIKSIQNIRTFELGLTSMFFSQKYDKNIQLKHRIEAFFSSPIKKIRNFSDLKDVYPAILIKIDPDLDSEIQKKVCEVALLNKIDGIIIGEMYNKKLEKDKDHIFEFFENDDMKNIENKALINVFKNTKGDIPIISSGNIFDGKEVIERIKNGASAVQISSSFILKGYKFINTLKAEVCQELKQKGVENITKLKGINVPH